MRNALLLFLLLTFTLSFSQHKFGVFTGVNYSYFTDGFAGQIGGEDSFGLQIGALYEIPLNEKVSFRPKLVFSQQGDRAKTTSDAFATTELTDLDYKLNYLNVPLDFKFWNKIYVIAGPQIGILISEKAEGAFVGPVKSTVDVGINLGTGFRINSFFAEIGVYQGLTSMFQYSYPGTGSIVDVRNGLAKFTVGYTFDVPKKK